MRVENRTHYCAAWLDVNTCYYMIGTTGREALRPARLAGFGRESVKTGRTRAVDGTGPDVGSLGSDLAMTYGTPYVIARSDPNED